jgi:U3 small nucleolar RNA-associated protein 21
MRSGHHAPPTKIRYYDEAGRFLLSVGRDRALRLFAVYRDVQNVELAQGKVEKRAKQLKVKQEEVKLPIATDFAACKGIRHSLHVICSPINHFKRQRRNGIGITS